MTMEKREASALPWAHLRLPPFPQVALRVLEMLQSENVSLPRLCELISTDAVFASELLTVSNSVLYAPRYPSTSVLQALTVVGANTLQGMCIMVGVRAYLGRTMHDPAMHRLWRHNLACALVAERLGGFGLEGKDSAFTAGILHDLGRIALSTVQPRAYAELLEGYRGQESGIMERERALFGQDHCETGLQLMKDWRLPEQFARALRDHHEPRRTDGAWDTTELIKVSCKIATGAGFPAFPGSEVTEYEELLKELPARERRLFNSDLESLRAEIMRSVESIEAA